MLGAGAVKPKDTAEERAKNVFMRFVDDLNNDDNGPDDVRMDENNDGTLTEEEFLKGCLQDDDLSKMLAPNVTV